MLTNWKEITDDELLNGGGSQAPEVRARYERIMHKRLIDSVIGLEYKLTGLMGTIYRASQGVQEKADKLFSLYDSISRAQTRQQYVLIFLSVVIAISTAVYTCITWQSVEAMREANEIQRQLLVLQKTSSLQQQSVPIPIPQGTLGDKAAQRP